MWPVWILNQVTKFLHRWNNYSTESAKKTSAGWGYDFWAAEITKPKKCFIEWENKLVFFCPCLLIGSRKRVSYFSAPINLYIWTAIPISIYYFCQMTSKLHFSHKHLENQNKKYFSICLANTVYVTYIFLGTGLEYLWPSSTKQELAFGQSFILYKSKSNNTNHNPYFLLNHPQTL